MKSIFYSLILISLGITGYSAYKVLNPCATPLKYSIGQFDTQFGESRNDFLKKVLTAETAWEKLSGKNFFDYDENAEFKINLIYDERQKDVDAKRKTEFGLSQAESSFKMLDSDYLTAKSQYDSRSRTYESTKASFLSRSQDYEAEVERINGKGGASPSEFNKLKQEREELNAQVASINSEGSALNGMLIELNNLLAKRNAAAESYNKIAESYNQQFGHGLEFDQAEYTGREINVYEFGNNNDLTLALSHELGHALGMDHVENPRSIMYYKTGDQTLTPTAEDLAEIKRVCRL
jgi:hypothetical protein